MSQSYKKNLYWRSKEHLKAVAELPCMRCGREGYTQAAHSNQLEHGKGRGIKASDQYAAALCMACHFQIDMGNKLSKQERRDEWNRAWERTVAELKERKRWVFKDEEND